MSEKIKDTWKLGDHEFTSRFILGSGKYSLDLIRAAVEHARPAGQGGLRHGFCKDRGDPGQQISAAG